MYVNTQRITANTAIAARRINTICHTGYSFALTERSGKHQLSTKLIEFGFLIRNSINNSKNIYNKRESF